MRVTKDMFICQVLEMHKDMEQVFAKYDLNCVGCPGGAGETISEAAEGHNVNLEKLLNEINELFND